MTDKFILTSGSDLRLQCWSIGLQIPRTWVHISQGLRLIWIPQHGPTKVFVRCKHKIKWQYLLYRMKKIFFEKQKLSLES